jgi:hypothetical protein
MLSLFFGIVVVLMLLLIVLVVAKEQQRSAHNARQTLAYPDAVPSPPDTSVVNGVDTTMMAPHIHDEDSALTTAMSRADDFSASIDTNNLSKGTSSPDSGYPGFESTRGSVFADKNA